MPIINKTGDLLANHEVNIICHQANLFTTFGAGIAAAIKEQYPEAYNADCQTNNGDPGKLGTFSSAKTRDGKTVLNCYSQTGMGATERNTSYNDIVTIFAHIEERVRCYNERNPSDPLTVGVPYGYGCGLAGGRWKIVSAIFESIFSESSVNFYIVRLPGTPDIK